MRIGDEFEFSAIGEESKWDLDKIIDQVKNFDTTKLPDYLEKAKAVLGRDKKKSRSSAPPPAPAPAGQFNVNEGQSGLSPWAIAAVVGGVGILAFAFLSKKGGPLAGLADSLDLPT